MSVRARILAIRITELVQKNPNAVAALRISATLASCKDRLTEGDKTTKLIVVNRIM